MKTGNRKQAVLLSIIAVGAIGFLAIQLVPGGLKPTFGGGVNATAASSVQNLPVDLPLALIGNPFSHPKLATKEPKTESSVEPPRDLQLPRPDFVGPLVPDRQFWVDSGSETEDIAGKDRQKPQGPKISLLAVMDAGTPVAYLQVDGNEPTNYKAGAKLAKGVLLVQVGHSFVKVLIGKEIVRIENGQTYGEVVSGEKE